LQTVWVRSSQPEHTCLGSFTIQVVGARRALRRLRSPCTTHPCSAMPPQRRSIMIATIVLQHARPGCPKGVRESSLEMCPSASGGVPSVTMHALVLTMTSRNMSDSCTAGNRERRRSHQHAKPEERYPISAVPRLGGVLHDRPKARVWVCTDRQPLTCECVKNIIHNHKARRRSWDVAGGSRSRALAWNACATADARRVGASATARPERPSGTKLKVNAR
jgi:hypothetical protein